jgi:dihydroxyacid dehydratase/phosphogluconate dehydratase
MSPGAAAARGLISTEETYQITSALRYLPFGREVAVITDARFSGVSTGASSDT